MKEQAKYHICHKCGKVRWIEKEVKLDENENYNSLEKVGLSYCGCMSQTEFDYERKARTLEEAIEIMNKAEMSTLLLFIGQKRSVDEIERLLA